MHPSRLPSWVLTPCLLGACTAPIEADKLELETGVPSVKGALPSWDDQPEAAPLPLDPRSQPHLEIVSLDGSAPKRYEGVCDYEVVGHGFPAIDEGGDTIIHLGAHVDGNSEGEDEYMLLSWLAPELDTRTQEVFDRGDDFSWSPAGESDHCDAATRELQLRVAKLNVELAADVWRPLEGLDVVSEEPGEGWEHEIGLDEAIEALLLDSRPVEALYRGGMFILRVRGSNIIDKQAKPGWQLDDGFCDRNPHIRGLEVNRATGMALVTVSDQAGRTVHRS